MLHERTVLSRKPEELARQSDALRDDDLLTPDLIFRDPYFLDFLGLKDAHTKKVPTVVEDELLVLDGDTGESDDMNDNEGDMDETD